MNWSKIIVLTVTTLRLGHLTHLRNLISFVSSRLCSYSLFTTRTSNRIKLHEYTTSPTIFSPVWVKGSTLSDNLITLRVNFLLDYFTTNFPKSILVLKKSISYFVTNCMAECLFLWRFSSKSRQRLWVFCRFVCQNGITWITFTAWKFKDHNYKVTVCLIHLK